jgi:hypothetical protein
VSFIFLQQTSSTAAAEEWESHLFGIKHLVQQTMIVIVSLLAIME